MEKVEFRRYQCWYDERIGRVINKDAIAVDRATFLATHLPLSTITYERSPSKVDRQSEDGLLEELLAQAREGTYVFAVVKGITGTGKSHLIRWLKEQYEATNQNHGDHDMVILIERSRGTLRDTLEQIISTGIFENTQLRDHARKLHDATVELSKEALEDGIINRLEEASIDSHPRDPDNPRMRRITARIRNFLLDPIIRDALKRPDGPVARIKQHLAPTDLNRQANRDELPGFYETDFLIHRDVRRRIDMEGGRPEVKQFADNLSDNQDLREELANYLNRRLQRAIGRMTALSADDLKSIFMDLRRELRKQGRNLALFIEDITSFTGIDAGLVEVLATQHTGDGNLEFCRLLSVTGITDGYFKDSFPDNLRDRVTHLVSLDTAESGPEESELLSDAGAVAALSAKYLNAMRLTQQDLDSWLLSGAHPEEVPNACTKCPVRAECHLAFGAVGRTQGLKEDSAIGLYPFNDTALWTMYRGLQGVRRTPRALLASVLLYVLQSHGPGVKEGAFPPPPLDVGNDFRPPSLENDLQRSVIREQAAAAADRVESLLRFWGDRTAYPKMVDGHRRLGNLTEVVFQAFDLPFIAGDESAMQPGLPTAHPHPRPPEQERGRGKGEVEPPRSTYPDPARPPDEAVHQGVSVGARPGSTSSRGADPMVEIENWARGQKLAGYEKYAEWLSNLIRYFVDWQGHGISPVQVSLRIRQGRIVIDGQIGQVATPDNITFSRSESTAAVLRTLLELSGDLSQLQTPNLTGHLFTLGHWLRSEEPRIVEYVRRRNQESADPLRLLVLLVWDCLGLELLRGVLSPSHASSPKLLLAMLRHSLQVSYWNQEIVRSGSSRCPQWLDLMKAFDDTKVQECRKQLLSTLNHPQGDLFEAHSKIQSQAKLTLFIDAASALDAINEVTRAGWQPPLVRMSVSPTNEQLLSSYRVYERLQPHLSTVLLAEQERLRGTLQALQVLIDEDGSADEAFAAMRTAVAILQQHKVTSGFEENLTLSAGKYTQLRDVLQSTAAEEDPNRRALALSAALDTIGELGQYTAYFKSFAQMANRVSAELEKDLVEWSATNSVGQLRSAVQREYKLIADCLREVVPSRSADSSLPAGKGGQA